MSEPPIPCINRSVVMIGLMGAGKSSVGRRLAARLNLPFIDADQEIEKAAGCSIEDFFELHGEAEFREAVDRGSCAGRLRGRTASVSGIAPSLQPCPGKVLSSLD